MNAAPSTSSRFYLAVSVLLYLVALLCPGFTHDSGKVLGVHALALGWMPAIFGIIMLFGKSFEFVGIISWFANIFILVTWFGIFTKRRSMAVIFSIITLCFSSLFFLTKEIAIPDGQTMTHVRVSYGAFLWIGSFVFAWLAAVSLRPGLLGNDLSEPASPKMP